MKRFELPPDDTLYHALIAKDPAYEGRAYVCVKTTGIFCRLTCPARKPKRENCLFFEKIGTCLTEGFRACMRCRPLNSITEEEPMVSTLLTALEENPSQRWSERDLVEMGLDPSTVRRTFKRHFGTTFLAMTRAKRVQMGAASLDSGGRVIDAQLEAGFESGSGFRAAFARILGRAPADLNGEEPLCANWIETPLGTMIAITDDACLHLLTFFDRQCLPQTLKSLQASSGMTIGVGRRGPLGQVEEALADYFGGRRWAFNAPLAPVGNPMDRTIREILRGTHPGDTIRCHQVAQTMDKPPTAQAIAKSIRTNPFGIIIPCHRLVDSADLQGYGGSQWRQRWLLEHEQEHFCTVEEN